MQKSYKAKSKLAGPCGPCSFINLTGIKGSPKKEEELSKTGRFKPFRGTMYTGFLEWGKRYNLPMQVYTTSKRIDKKMFEFILKFEKTPKQKQPILKNKAIRLFEKQNKLYKDKIQLIDDVTEKLNSLLKEKHKVAVCLTVFNSKKREYIPHWVVAYKRVGNYYHFMDSSKSLEGYRILSKDKLSRWFKKSKEMGFPPALVVIEKD
jgi:hypothetical protein